MSVIAQEAKPLMREAVRAFEQFFVCQPYGASHKSSGGEFSKAPQSAKSDFLVPNSNRDLAVQEAFQLAIKTKGRVGYLAVGESAQRAVMRMWLRVGGTGFDEASSGELDEAAILKLTRLAVVIADSRLCFSSPAIRRSQVKQTTRAFIESCALDYLVVDDVDTEALRNPSVPPELDSQRIRMELSAVVKQTRTMLILPG